MPRTPVILYAPVFMAIAAFAAPVLAKETLPDRAKLSYEENVTINMICSQGGHASNSRYESCVHDQLVQLMAHPTPDRSSLSNARFLAVQKQCSDYRLSGFAEYNDCIKQAMAAPAPKGGNSPSSPGEELSTNFAAIIAKAPAAKPVAATPVVAAPLPLPATVLPRRPAELRNAALTPADLYKRVEGSIYIVVAAASLADVQSREFMIGSAVAVAPHLLLTNCHVVRGRAIIKLVQDETVGDAKLAASDDKVDRCVLSAPGLTLRPVAGLRGFGELAVGEHIFAVGTPLGLARTLSEGLISGLRRTEERNLIQVSAPISPGSSGGGLFDERGNLIGITTLASIAVGQNLNFAVAAADFWN